MRSGHVLSLVAAALLANVAGGCAGVKSPTLTTDGGNPGTGGTIPGIDASRPMVDGITVNTANCGNGTVNDGEQCDDGNKTPGDGCSAICQIPAGWSCSGSPSVCTMAGVCGDGILGASEACDDKNTTSGDGCSADCKTVETGYECRVPARRCVPACGDGKIIGMEQCDDGNVVADDGCSPTCQIEPGASCTGMPSVCKASICGNGMKEGNEGCDCGTSLTGPWPTGCGGPNGLFFGDASGCSKTCTKEPSCRTGATTQACAISCGNGAVEMGEACDDGNLDDGDGCSKTCTLEGGFMCSSVAQPDTAPCTQTGNTGECLSLPVIYRDFKNESVSGGHPDFFYLGATVANPVSITGVQGQAGATTFNKRYCVPNSSGPAKKNDSANRCWDLAQANLGANGKPVFNMTRTGGTNCDCQFIDWSHDTNGGHVPGYAMAQSPTIGLTYTDGASGHPMYRGPAPVVTSATTFGQWWVDGTWTGGAHSVGLLEMKAIGGGQYQFSSQVNSVTGGFFPLDPPAHGFPLYTMAPAGPGTPPNMVGTEAMLCNLWPYWHSTTAFGAGNNCRGDQYLFPPSLTAADTPTTCPTGMNCNGKWYVGQQGWFHDSWFTTRPATCSRTPARSRCSFTATMTCSSSSTASSSSTWVASTSVLPGRVVVDAAGMATITEGGSLDITNTTIVPCPGPDPYTGLTMNARPTPTATATATARAPPATAATGRSTWAWRWAAPTRSPCSARIGTRPSRTTS
jgi:cysteine-rich repeat protein